MLAQEWIDMTLRELIINRILFAVTEKELNQYFQTTSKELFEMSDLDLFEIYEMQDFEQTI
jgi:hypothetical protein